MRFYFTVVFVQTTSKTPTAGVMTYLILYSLIQIWFLDEVKRSGKTGDKQILANKKKWRCSPTVTRNVHSFYKKFWLIYYPRLNKWLWVFFAHETKHIKTKHCDIRMVEVKVTVALRQLKHTAAKCEKWHRLPKAQHKEVRSPDGVTDLNVHLSSIC